MPFCHFFRDGVAPVKIKKPIIIGKQCYFFRHCLQEHAIFAKLTGMAAYDRCACLYE